ncbi:hypothetical protein [Flindersiella endophytica]
MPIDAASPLTAVALAVSTVVSLAVLVAAGWLTERLLGHATRDWARRVAASRRRG